MPNWTKNEVTFTSAKTTNIKKIKEIFKKGSPFNQIIQEPKWDEIPLNGNEMSNNFEKKPLGIKGELPIIEEQKLWNGETTKMRKFKSTNTRAFMNYYVDQTRILAAVDQKLSRHWSLRLTHNKDFDKADDWNRSGDAENNIFQLRFNMGF